MKNMHKSFKNYINLIYLIIGIFMLSLSCGKYDYINSSIDPLLTIYTINYEETVLIEQEGGIIEIPNFVKLTIPAGVLTRPTNITLKKTKSSKLTQLFDVDASIFMADLKSDYQASILTDEPISTDLINISLCIPDHLINNLQSGYGVDLFSLIYADGGEEILDHFTLIDSIFDLDNREVSTNIPDYAFTNQRRSDGLYEAIVTIASTPGTNILKGIYSTRKSIINQHGILQSALEAEPGNKCVHSSLIKPLSPPVKRELISSDFGKRINPVSGLNTFHYGVDYPVPVGTNIYAVSNGIIESIGYDPKGYGNYLILRHSDNSASLYAHLSVSNITYKGAFVFKGEIIAKSGGAKGALGSGSSTGPHLHFEYVPGGTIIHSKERVCPWPLINYIYPSLKGYLFSNSSIDLYINGTSVVSNSILDEINLRSYFMLGESSQVAVTFIMYAKNPYTEGTQFSASCGIQFINCPGVPYYIYNGSKYTVTTPTDGRPPQIYWGSFPYGYTSGVLANWTEYPIIVEY